MAMNPMSGGCQCGAIRYRLTTPPIRATLCHCRMCQKAVGQPFAAYATVAMEDFAWTRGTPPAFRSSSAAERHFCPSCGTSLTFRYLHEAEMAVAVGTLDQPANTRPERHYGVESRLAWMDGGTLDALPNEATQWPGDAPDFASFQHPDHDTPVGWRPRCE